MANEIDDLQPIPERRRWFMLTIFSTITLLSAFQWMHLTIIAPSTSFFWNGSLPSDEQEQEVAITWLSMIYMLMYIPMVIPGTWLLNRYGLRVALLTGAGLNAFGACVKCASMELSQPNGVDTAAALSSFSILMFGQCICALAQVFTLGMPAQLAATWFGESEIELATAIGVFSNQIGCALGFCLPPLMVPSPTDLSIDFRDYLVGFRILLYSGTAVMLLAFSVVLIFFRERPKTSPSRAQFKRILQREGITSENANSGYINNSYLNAVETEIKRSFLHQVYHCFKNLSFILLTICYGVNTGVYYEIGILLNAMVTNFYPDEQTTIGWIGFSMIISGLFGSIVAGIILKKTGQYRRVFLAFYLLSVVSWCAFMGSLYTPHISVIFFTMILLGFFQSGFLPLGFEFAAEITYPIDEGLTSGILNTSAQIFGIAITYSSTALLHQFGPLITNIFSLVCLLVAALPACFVKADLKRRRAQQLVSTDVE